MKIHYGGLLCAALFFLPASMHAGKNAKPFVIPELQEWKGQEGDFVPSATTRIVYASKDADAARIAQQFADDYETMFGQRLAVVEGRSSKGDFVLSLSSDKRLGEEGYTMNVKDRVYLSSLVSYGKRFVLGDAYRPSDCRAKRRPFASERISP